MNGLRSVLVGALAVATLLVPQAARAAETPAPAERIASLKEKLKQNQAALKGYEWIETVVVSFKGEEKTRKQNRCYYGADGALEKVPVGETPEAKTKRGVRGKVAAEKKEEITQYLARSAEAIKQYVPPDPARVQACKDAGKATIAVLEPDKRVRLEFRDYRVPGDLLGIEVDLSTNRLLGLNVTTVLAGEKDPVDLKVEFGTLEDGTGYPKRTVLTAQKVGVTVQTENSGYKKGTS